MYYIYMHFGVSPIEKPNDNICSTFIRKQQREYYTRNALAGQSLGNFISSNSSQLAYIVGSLRPSDLLNVTNASRLDAAIALIEASPSTSSLSSIQRRSLFAMLMSGAAYNVGTSNTSIALSALNSSVLTSVAELFIEAPYVLSSVFCHIINTYSNLKMCSE